VPLIGGARPVLPEYNSYEPYAKPDAPQESVPAQVPAAAEAPVAAPAP